MLLYEMVRGTWEGRGKHVGSRGEEKVGERRAAGGVSIEKRFLHNIY